MDLRFFAEESPEGTLSREVIYPSANVILAWGGVILPISHYLH